MGKIWEHDPLYSIVRPYADSCTRYSYRKIEIIGKDRIPDDGAVIFAPNHCNALMDAMVMLRSRHEPTVFGARADLFRQKAIGAFMTFLRILPMVRVRDGIRNVLGNLETMDKITDVLANGVPFCMFSEGTHRTMHSLLPLKKGIFRTAWTAMDAMPGQKIYIVPVGLEYGDYFRYRSTCLMEFGEPMDFTSFVAERSETPQGEVYRELSAELASRMASLITFIPDDPDYESKWALIKMIGATKASDRLIDIRQTNRDTAAAIEAALADPNRSDTMKDLLGEVLGFDKARRDRMFSIHSFEGCRFKGLVRLPLAICLLPLFIVSAVVTFPVWGIITILRRISKDTAFHNSLRLGVRVFIGMLMMLLWLILGACLLPDSITGLARWAIVIAGFLAYMPLVNLFYDWKEFFRHSLSDFRLLLTGSELRREFNVLVDRFKKICSI